jgi:hypothetical protein
VFDMLEVDDHVLVLILKIITFSPQFDE